MVCRRKGVDVCLVARSPDVLSKAADTIRNMAPIMSSIMRRWSGLMGFSLIGVRLS
jgi:hypothetical protein